MTRTACLGALVLALVLWASANALACACLNGPVPSSLAARHADIVFVGTVTRIDHPLPLSTSRKNADGSTTVTVQASSGPDRVFFDVAHVYKGAQVPGLVLLRGDTTCDMAFQEGEKWIVYAEDNGGVRAYGCSRTRLYAEAAQDVIYLENAEQRRPQGIVYGDVFRHRGAASDHTLYAANEVLRVVAANASGTFSTTTDNRWGPFELVLPPGDFEIWVERADKPVAPRRAIHVDNATDLRVQLIVEYDDVQADGVRR